MTIVAGGPVRNRDWIIDRHLNAVYRNGIRDALYLFNNSSDRTAEYLYRARWPSVAEYTKSVPTDEQVTPRGYNSTTLSFLRNIWAQQAIQKWPQATHLWVVDSDILPDPDCLKYLLCVEADIVGAYVPIMDGVTPIHMEGWNEEEQRAYRTKLEKTRTTPHSVYLVGGCYLVKTNAFKKGLIWQPGEQGEDQGFANKARELGLTMMVHPHAKTKHIMSKDQ